MSKIFQFLVKILFICFFISCSIPNAEVSDLSSEAEEAEEASLSDDIEKGNKDQKSTSRKPRLRSKKNVNKLDQEEILLSRESRQAKRGFSVRSEKVDNLLCRRMSGCRKFCSDWLNKNTSCHQWSANTVMDVWSLMLDSFNSEQMLQNIQWVSQNQDVSVFLQNSDKDLELTKKITSKLSQQNCPVGEGLKISHTPLPEDSNNTELYLIHPEGQEKGLKKIMDPDLFSFNLPLFKGSLKKCLAGGSLIESMLEHSNHRGFHLAHQVLQESCGGRKECLQLAYCKINSEKTWSHINEIRYQDSFDTDVHPSLCSYNDFESLPPLL